MILQSMLLKGLIDFDFFMLLLSSEIRYQNKPL